MTHTEAIRKLIDRNVSLVKRKGASDYSRETDKLINTILQYIHETDKELNRLKTLEKNNDIVFILFGLPDVLKTVDIEFLERYLKFDVMDGMYVFSDWSFEGFEITPQYIVRKFEAITRSINDDFNMYKFAVDNQIITTENYNTFEKSNKNWFTWFKHNYSEKEIKEILKREKYYDYERVTR